MTRPLRDSTAAELEAFADTANRLGGFAPQVHAEWADGWLAALATGLTLPPFEEWVQAMAGDAFDRAFGDPESRAAAEQALAGRLAVLRDQLDAEALDEEPDMLRLSPLMSEWSDEDRAAEVAEHGLTAEQAAQLVTGGEWAEGFLAAVGDRVPDWPEPDEEGAEAGLAMLHHVAALRLPHDSEALRDYLRQTYDTDTAERDSLVDAACLAAQDLRLWAVDHAPRPETRRVEKTPGRNDPCPCGSGKKFKKCHGA